MKNSDPSGATTSIPAERLGWFRTRLPLPVVKVTRARSSTAKARGVAQAAPPEAALPAPAVPTASIQ
jgi:hypothetical protein